MTYQTFKDYGDAAYNLAVYPVKHSVVYPALKLAGEAGEVADKVGKHLRGDYPLDKRRVDDILFELGDVLWYINALAKDLSSDLETVAAMNLEKLHDRMNRGVVKGDGDKR